LGGAAIPMLLATGGVVRGVMIRNAA
jgi:hypothetical protein